MAQFPDNLPPEGLYVGYKLLIYLGVLYVISTAITTWLITKRRSFPKPSPIPSDPSPAQESPRVAVSITESISFEDTKDKLSSLKVEIQGAEAALSKLSELRETEQVSVVAYQQLSEEYNDRVQDLTSQMNELLQSNIQSSTGEIEEGISEEDMAEIEADLEKQLMDLDDDSFLKPRPKRKIDDIFEEEQTPATPVASTPKPSTPSSPPNPIKPAQPRATPPSTPSSTPSSPPTPASQSSKKVPMPPPPSKSSSQPASPAVTRPPPPSKKATPPPPPKSSEAAPTQPKAQQPLSAAQPMKVTNEEDDGMFAKSTSIAALRMDMLRELARLKKLIPEDEKDQ